MNYHNSINSFSVNIFGRWLSCFFFLSVAKPWIKTGMLSKWPSFRVPLEIPALAVPLVTARVSLQNKGLAVESRSDGKGCGGKAAVAAASRVGCPESKRCSHVSELHEKRVRLWREEVVEGD